VPTRIAANPVNDRMMHLPRGQIDRYRHLSVATSAPPHQSVGEHEAILRALEVGDVSAAKRAMHDHIVTGRDSVLVAVRSLSDSGVR
jgi:DNA-binding FadR family transcriptional regulator